MTERILRPIRIVGNLAYVSLTQGYESVIDAADMHLVSGKNWHAIVSHRTFYAQSYVRLNDKRSPFLLHRAIVSCSPLITVDHINGDGLDNRRVNLRVATHAQNMRNARRRSDNKSGFKGVCFDKRSSKWRATITCNGTQKNLGFYDNPEQAHHAYIEAAKKLHGEFARIA